MRTHEEWRDYIHTFFATNRETCEEEFNFGEACFRVICHITTARDFATRDGIPLKSYWMNESGVYEGVPISIADVAIAVYDILGELDIDVGEEESDDPPMKTLSDLLESTLADLWGSYLDFREGKDIPSRNLEQVIHLVYDFARRNWIDLHHMLEVRMEHYAKQETT